MNRIETIKNLAYFFCVVSSASLSAMELEVQKPKDYCVVQKALLCDEIMTERGVPQEVAAIVKRDACCALRIDTIYKKFDPFFHFDRRDYRGYGDMYMERIQDWQGAQFLLLAAQEYAHRNCRKFDVVTPQHLFFFTENQDEILFSLISRPGCFVGYRGKWQIKLTSEEHEKYFMLPAEFRDILSKYPRSCVSKQ